MNHGQLKKFAQNARVRLMSQIGSRLDYVISHDDEYLRLHAGEKKIINEKIKSHGKQSLIEETAYIWFNRFTAILFMDYRGYNRVRMLSPLAGEVQPQVMAEIKAGRVPPQLATYTETFFRYLDGKLKVQDPDREVYKTALLGWCEYLGSLMPWMFSSSLDWAALLLPLDLLSAESVTADFRNCITQEDCGNVEIIGWLYQYYISGKKDQVFEDLKKNRKIEPENIPAATQLFTPHWIVRYMVDNSLGRLYLDSFPGSRIREKLEYYIENEKPENFLRIEGPQDIRLIDPCCGSGHILVYAFDLLCMMYEEEGYSAGEIPSLVIKNNLYGFDIDGRAASLSSFALAMKGMERDRFFLERKIYPNIKSPEEIKRDPESAGIKMGSDLKKSFSMLGEVKNFGSLIPVGKAASGEIDAILPALREKKNRDFVEDEILEGLELLHFLSPRYHCVITNPPYMGGKGMNARLSEWVKSNYPDSKTNLFAMFIERCLSLTVKQGMTGMITMQSWMFLSSFEKLREKILNNTTVLTMAHLGADAFDSIGGEVVSTTSFVLGNEYMPDYKGAYLRLVEGKSEAEKNRMLLEAVRVNK